MTEIPLVGSGWTLTVHPVKAGRTYYVTSVSHESPFVCDEVLNSDAVDGPGRLKGAMIMPLHCSLGNTVRPCLFEKNSFVYYSSGQIILDGLVAVFGDVGR